MASVARIHLICGATGAGKSTYAEQLAQDIGGLRFSIDEWMQQLHNKDKPEQDLFEWFYERVQRNCVQMRTLAERLADLNVPAIFDCGLTNAQERAIFTDWAEEKGLSLHLHFVDVATEIRWQRVQHRNAAQADTFQFHVSRDMFDFIESIWQPPTDEELSRLPHSIIKS